MDAATRRRLEALVRRFYARHGASFDRSRDRPWRGWERLLELLPAPVPGTPLRVLDAGCGNGRFAIFLADRRLAARRPGDVAWLGVDADLGLLAAARRRLAAAPLHTARLVALALADLDAMAPGRWDLAVAFGVLHHLPGEATRAALLRALARRLAPGGALAVSWWRFDRDPHWRRRLVPWQHALPDLDPTTLDPGDHLLAWQNDPTTPRYCHLTDAAERQRLLATVAPLRLAASWEADAGNEYWLLR